MLTEKELMIGDLVMYNPNVFIEDEYEPYQEWYPMKITSGEGIELAIEDCYDSIPLTTEILEKNGFLLTANDTWVLIDKYTNDEIIILRKIANGFIMLTEGMTIGLQNVHELQHVLKLLGIKKEIEL